MASKLAFEAHDEAFVSVVGDEPRLVKVIDVDAHEGPVYVPREDALYFTTLPRTGDGAPHVAVKRVALDGYRFPVEPGRIETVRADANAANGMTRDGDGRLVICEQGSRARAARVSRLDLATGSVETLVQGCGDAPLNSPNDVVVASDGALWFTDPSYGHLQGFRPEPGADRVCRHDPRSGRTSVVADSLDKPNGVALSPDESVLYITDSGANQEPGSFYAERPHHIVAFDVVERQRLGGRRLFAVTTPGFPDGIKTDSEGRVYASAFSGVQVFHPSGVLLGEIHLPGAVNFTFGAPGNDVLFITTDEAVWAAVLRATGRERALKGA